MRYDYYRDANIALEAFKAGQYDFRAESSAKAWAIGYASPALTSGLFKKEQIKHEIPQGMQAYVFNTRRAIFKDARVRRAAADCRVGAPVAEEGVRVELVVAEEVVGGAAELPRNEIWTSSIGLETEGIAAGGHGPLANLRHVRRGTTAGSQSG